MTQQTAKLTEGPVGRHLVAMTLPMMIGISATMGVYLVDTWFVGQLGTDPLAAIAFTFPVVFTLTSVAIGLGAGTSSVLARAIGAHDAAQARRIATDALVLAFLITLVLALIGAFTIEPLFRLLGAPPDMIPMIRDYMLVWYAGMVFVVVPMVGMASLRATGDARIPGMLMIASALLNAVLDPLLIFGLGPFPRLELTGAAVAGLIGRAAAFVGAIWVLHFRLRLLTLDWPGAAAIGASWRRILHVGLPAAGTNTIIPVSIGVVTAMLAGYGPEVVAGFGVASRVEGMMLITFFAMSAIIGPVVGQNLSARKPERIFEALSLCTRFCLGLGLVLALVLAVFGRPLAALFSDEPRVVTVAATYFLIVPVSYGTAGMVMVMNASFNGIGRPLPAVVVSVMRMVVLYLPLAWAGSALAGYPGIFAAYAAANVICGFGAWRWAVREVARQQADMPAPAERDAGHGNRAG
ncbi:MAG: MATE family efflux transporter [Gammaproteobacteria bacterium]|jgi:putative MATE family efflux protein|nr:MATE family efflux transporter [Gammaproteobacteria bacterium]